MKLKINRTVGTTFLKDGNSIKMPPNFYCKVGGEGTLACSYTRHESVWDSKSMAQPVTYYKFVRLIDLSDIDDADVNEIEVLLN